MRRLSNFIRTLDNKAAIHKGRLRLNGWSIIGIFVFGSQIWVLRYFELFSSETLDKIEEVCSIIVVTLLGESILMGLYRLSPRHRWETLTYMGLGGSLGFGISVVKQFLNNDFEDMTLLAIFIIMVVLGAVSLWRWRYHIRRLRRIKFNRQLDQQRRQHRVL